MTGRVLYMVVLLMTFIRPLSADVFSSVDWSLLERSSSLPCWSTSQPLPQDFSNYEYSARIEYPEFEPLSAEDSRKWNLDLLDLPEWPVVDTYVGISAHKGYLDVSFLPVVKRAGIYQKIVSFKLVVSRNAVLRSSSRRDAVTDRYVSESVLSQGDWVMIRIPETGVYKLTDKFLKSAGFSNPSKVRLYGYGGNVLPERALHELPDDLEEIPLWRENGYALFYGRGPVSWKVNSAGVYEQRQNTYSEYGYYFLTANDSLKPAAVPVMESQASAATLVESYPDYVLHEKEEFSWTHSGSQFFEEYDFQNGSSRRYPFALDGMTGDSVRVTVRFSAKSKSQSILKVRAGLQEVGAVVVKPIKSYEAASVSEASFICRNMFSDMTDVVLEHERDAGVSGHLDYIRLNFERRLELRGSQTAFRTGNRKGNVRFAVAGANDDTRLWAVDADGRLSMIESELSDGICLSAPVAVSASTEYVAVDVRGTFPEPVMVGSVPNQNLHGLSDVDMVIIVPSSGKITAQAERLANLHRQYDGLCVQVVTAQEIYNEFSSGTPDATAYRRFMKMLYDRAGVSGRAPGYLLLFGDGAWDNRMLTSAWRGVDGDDYLLCFESENSISDTQSYVMEDYFGLLDDSEGVNLLYEKVDLGVGRFPVTTAAQAQAMVDKIESYMSGRYAGAWQNRILLLGDDGDNNLHMSDAEDVAAVWQTRHPSLLLKKLYWDNFRMEATASGNSYPTVTTQLLREFEEGALIVDYVGHGSPDVLSHELVLDKFDMSALDSPRLPFWITASCDISPFDGSEQNIGENLILNPNGGAIGLLSTARTVYSSQNTKINQLFSDYVLSCDDQGKRYALGDALRLSKVQLVTGTSDLQDYSENKIHYVLLGDPALKLNVAEYHAVVDSFQIEGSADENPMVSAGQVVTVSGHIEDLAGAEVPGFSGMVFQTVLDSERKIVTLNNADDADDAFEYMDRDRIIFSGSDSVRSGRFRFQFPVPMDINYSDESGKLILYALADDMRSSANCSYDNFLIGGTSQSLNRDSLGPDISLYLNTPEFEYWGQVNSTPCLVVELSDPDGLNTSGNGIGHDLLLVIDNRPELTFNLNHYFVPEPGDYTRGRVVFSLPELPEGKHTLMFRAWDVLNNSSSAQLGFQVVKGLKPQLRASVSANPATEKTTFVISHDRPVSNVSVTVRVVDSTGRPVWEKSVNDNSTAGVTLIDWNLYTYAGRARKGIYIYQVTVTDGVTSSHANGKLVVIQ